MTRNEFDKWVEKKYPVLGVMARNVDLKTGDDLLHTTIEYILSHKSYVRVTKGAMYWFAKVLKGRHVNYLEHEAVKEKYDILTVPSPLGFNPEKLLENKIYLKELWPKFQPVTRRFLSAIAAGNSAKDFYSKLDFCTDPRGVFSQGVSYSAFLKIIKADMERAVSN